MYHLAKHTYIYLYLPLDVQNWCAIW
jgi:hypothetical protein